MDSIFDLLKNKASEPSQVQALKDYAQQNHGVAIQVRSTSKYYLITVPNAPLSHKFRLESQHITQVCKLDKRLVIHIGY